MKQKFDNYVASNNPSVVKSPKQTLNRNDVLRLQKEYNNTVLN